MCYCSNIDGLFEALESEHHFNEWRLLIDSIKASLKAVLLNNRNEKPNIFLVHATARKETCETIELILPLINYSAFNWNICGNLKVKAFFLACRWVISSIHSFCVFGTAATMSNIISKKIGFYMKSLFQKV